MQCKDIPLLQSTKHFIDYFYNMPNHFAFRIRKDAFNYYSVSNDVVVLLAAPADKTQATPMDIQGPANWNEEGIRWSRHPKYFGITTAYSESLRFVGDGAKIVAELFYRGGIEEPLQLEVWAIANYNESWLYSPYFIGDIDLTTFDPDIEAGGIKVNIKDGGAAAIIKAGENIPFEIEIKQPGCPYIKQDGIILQGTFNWLVTANSTQTVPVSNGTRFSLLNAHILDDGDFPVAIAQTTFLLNMGSDGDTDFVQTAPRDHFNYLLDPLQDIISVQAHLQHTLTYRWQRVGGGPSERLTLKIEFITAKDRQPFTVLETLYTDAALAKNTDHTVTLDLLSTPISILQGERVHVIYSWVPSGGLSVGDTYLVLLTNPEGNLSIKTTFVLPTTVCPGMRPDDLGFNLIYLLTKNQYHFKSDFLTTPGLRYIDTYPSNWVYFPGDAARQIPDAKMAITLSDWMQSLLVEAGMGLGIEGEFIRIEPLSHFYNRDNEICTLDDISKFRAVPDLTHAGNVLNVGIDDQTYDILNGKNEVNGKHIYGFPFTRVNNVIDLVSPIRTDFTGIEQVRSVYGYKKTTDNKADREVFSCSINDNFYVSIGDDGPIVPIGAKVYDLYRPQNDAGSSATGIMFSETAYNLDRTPKRSFYRNAPLINMYNYKRDGQQITFQTFEKNQLLISNLGDGEITETAIVALPINEAISGLKTEPIFLPMLLQFTAVLPHNFNELMLSNPYGFIRVIWDGIVYKGFVNKIAQIDAECRVSDVELQAHPDCDFSGLRYV